LAPLIIQIVHSSVKRLVLAVLACLLVIWLNSPLLAQVTPPTAAQDQTPVQSREVVGRQPIRGGWYPWDPYQYLEGSGGGRRELTGLDVRLLREAFEGELGRDLELPEVSWKQHQLDIRTGLRDVAGGAFRTAERETYAHYSKPYRFEEVVVYRRRFEPIGTQALQNSNTLQQELDSGTSKIGLVRGYHYGEAIAAFAADQRHASRIVWADDHEPAQWEGPACSSGSSGWGHHRLAQQMDCGTGVEHLHRVPRLHSRAVQQAHDGSCPREAV
jgi:ABC-type amino acid transport substrate-binding protein